MGALDGKRVLVTRPPHQSAVLSHRIRELGGEPVEAPTIVIREGDRESLLSALEDLERDRFVAVCLTSANGVAAVADVLEEAELGVAALSRTMVAALGPGTAQALEAIGVTANLVPEEATTAALGRAFPAGEGEVLLPRADIASSTLPTVLRERGYTPVEVDAYVTARPEGLPDGVAEALAAGRIDLVTFTSASTVHNFVELVDDWSGAVISIGPVTTAACHDLGIEVAAEASRHDVDGLVEAVVQHVTTRT